MRSVDVLFGVILLAGGASSFVSVHFLGDQLPYLARKAWLVLGIFLFTLGVLLVAGRLRLVFTKIEGPHSAMVFPSVANQLAAGGPAP